MAALSVSGHAARKVPYAGFAYPRVSHVRPPFACRYARRGESEADFAGRLLGELEAGFVRVGPGTIAETRRSWARRGGCVTPPRGYLAGVGALCGRYGVLMVLDEVMRGTGRTGSFFAFGHEGVVPDICRCGQGARRRLRGRGGRLRAWARRGGAARGVAGLSPWAHIPGAPAVVRGGARGAAGCAARRARGAVPLALGGLRSVGDIRGRGLFWAVELVRDGGTREPFDPGVGFGRRVQQEALCRGVAGYRGAGTVDGVRGDDVLLAPPFTVTEEELRLACGVLRGGAVEAEERIHL